MTGIDACWFGRTPYGEALRIMEAMAEHVRLSGEEVLLLMEHPPVVTLGRNASRENLLLTPEQYAARGYEVHDIGRGGDVTFHGPGQLMGYPVAQVGRLVLRHVDRMFDSLRELLTVYGIEAAYDPEHPGLWVGDAKIAAVGVEIRDGVSLHGFSLNAHATSSGFETIVPCGLTAKGVVAMSELAPIPALEVLAEEYAWRYAALRRRRLNYLPLESFKAKYTL